MRSKWLLLLCLLVPTLAQAGVPRTQSPTTDTALANYLKSLENHLNTLECLTKDPDGTTNPPGVLGGKGDLKCAEFDSANHLCMNTSTGPQKGTDWLCLAASGGIISGTGSDTQVTFWTGASTVSGDEGFTFTQSTNLVNINEATDGDSILLRLDNDLANSGVSTNETAQIRFGFGSDTDVARILAGKQNGFQDADNSDAFLAFNIDINGSSNEVFRITGNDTTRRCISVNSSSCPTTNDPTVYIKSASDTGTASAFLIQDTTATLDILRAYGSDTVDIGDADYTSQSELRLLSGSEAMLTIRGSRLSNNLPAVLKWLDNLSSYSSRIILHNDTLAGGGLYPTAKYMAWEFTDLTGITAETPLLVFNQYFDSATPVALALASGTTITNEKAFIFNAPLINGVTGGATETCTNCATVYINNAPSGSDISFTNGPYALWVNAGAVRFDGNVTYNGTQTSAGDLTIQKADPTLIYDVTTATDTDFWAGVQDDAGGDDDDFYQIGKGTTPGTTPLVTIMGTGFVGVGNVAPAGKFVVDFPTTQTIAAGNTVAADACGSLKLITATGAVTTDTTNTFTAPAAANKGCLMHVCNTGANNITLDTNANFKSAGAADVVMTQDDCVTVGSTGGSGVWYQLTALVAN